MGVQTILEDENSYRSVSVTWHLECIGDMGEEKSQGRGSLTDILLTLAVGLGHPPKGGME